MQRFLYLIALMLLCLPLFAQTEYDIQLFMDNVSNERPRAEELQFYLKSADKLARSGRLKEANIFYDFASSLGCVEGFIGKASTEDGPEKIRHQFFARRDTEESQILLSSLENANRDLASALLIHDNLSLFCLNSIRDPLLEWMPTTAADSLFLRSNDQYAYMIACLKEEDGNLLDALYLYDIAAWQGNYEALLKARYIGAGSVERKLKDALIKRKENNESLISLHKYFAGEQLSAQDYLLIYEYLDNLSERLIALSLGIYDTAKDNDGANPKATLADCMHITIDSRRRLNRQSAKIKYLHFRTQTADSDTELNGLRERQRLLQEELKKDELELDNVLRRLKKLSSSTAEENGEWSIINWRITQLEDFCTRNMDYVFSSEAVRYIKKQLKQSQAPWSDSVLRVLGNIKTSDRVKRDIQDNTYYPLYEKGLFSSIHHTRKIIPQVIQISDE